jgi:hypothetical protein
LKEGSAFSYLRETKKSFAILINYGGAKFSEADGKAAFQLLTGELKDQFLGFISGESVGYVWEHTHLELKISSSQSQGKSTARGAPAVLYQRDCAKMA